MNCIQWNKLITSFVIWLTTEIVFTSLGLDDLADYGEFINRQPMLVLMG